MASRVILNAGNIMWCRVNPGSMEPPTHDQPGKFIRKFPGLNNNVKSHKNILFLRYHAVVCAGIGSGLAPHQSFIRDRVHASKSGVEVAPFSLYFGNRFKAREFLYRTELEQIAEKHKDWFKLHTAFSRDTAGKKVYVQDLVAITDDAYKYLLERQGMLYVCGNRNLPKPLQKSLKASFAQGKVNKESAEEVAKAVEDLFVHGRGQQEVW